MTHITIDHRQVRQTAPDLYGLFFEDINRSSDSGLYPEMLRNRSFEDSIAPAETTQPDDASYFRTKKGHIEPFYHGEGIESWSSRHPYTPIPGWYTENAEMALDDAVRLNEHREVSLRVSFEAGGILKNIGYCGVSAQKDYPLHFYGFFITGEPCDLSIRLQSQDGTVLAEGAIRVPASATAVPEAGAFERFDLRLVPIADDSDCVFVITSEQKAEINIGFVSLMPEKTYNDHGLREDLVGLLKKTNSKFMRYPGGCIVEGLNKATALKFSEIVGPVWERPSIWNLWHYRASYGFGFHEFLQLCEDLNMEALYVVNCGMTCQARCPEFYLGEEMEEMIRETLWAIEYATGDKTTRWGALRAAMGHPEPFRLKYIEIGNENDGPEYDKRYREIYDRIHEAHPEIVLISNAHTEKRGLPTDFVDEHYYFDWQFFAQSGRMYDHYPTEGPGIFIGEYAVTRGADVGNLHAALSETRYLMGCEAHPEVIRLAAYAPLFENVHYKQWNPNLIFFDNHRSAALPTLEALSMLGESRGTQLLSSVNDSAKIIPTKYGFEGMIAYGSGLRMKQPLLDGTQTRVYKEILGQWHTNGDELVSDTKLPDGKKYDSITRYPIQATLCNGLFSDRKVTEMTFTTRVFIDEQTPKFALTLWGHDVTEPGVMRMEPSDNGDVQPKGTYGLGDMEYYTWTIDGAKGQSFLLYRYQELPLNEAAALPVQMGEFNEFTIVSGKGWYDCYLNGTLVSHVEDRYYRHVDVIATEDETHLYVKLLNNTDTEEMVNIQFDTPCEDAFEWSLLSGEPGDRNTLEEPDRVAVKKGTACGAAAIAAGSADSADRITEGLSWTAPAWSFTVLKIRKA